MSAYLDRPCRSYRQALADRCAQAVKRGAQDHSAERELARINTRRPAHMPSDDEIMASVDRGMRAL